MSQLRYAGYIAIPVEVTPRPQDTHGCIGIENLHCTVLLPKQVKVVKETHDLSIKKAKAFVKEVIANHPDPPLLVLGSESHLATRLTLSDVHEGWHDEYGELLSAYEKPTYFLEVLNQEEMQTYLDTLTDALGIPNVERFFHVSIANDTGKPQDSIPDINADDLGGE